MRHCNRPSSRRVPPRMPSRDRGNHHSNALPGHSRTQRRRRHDPAVERFGLHCCVWRVVRCVAPGEYSPWERYKLTLVLIL